MKIKFPLLLHKTKRDNKKNVLFECLTNNLISLISLYIKLIKGKPTYHTSLILLESKHNVIFFFESHKQC